MSTLSVSNITDGTDTVGTSYVVNGSAKAWSYGRETTVNDSFNISSATDNGVGLYLYNLSSSMANATYPVSGMTEFARLCLEYEGTLSSSVYGIGVRQTDGTGFSDSNIGTMVQGRLA